MVLLEGCKGKAMSVRQGSPYYINDEYDFDEDNDNDADDDRERERDESDEDTEEASETEMRKNEEYTEIKEQVYQDKLANLKRQLQQLKDDTHPEYNRKLRKLEMALRERIRVNIVWREYLIECVERDYVNEKRAAAKELEEKKVELRASLVSDMEEKKKVIEAERVSMELSGDSTESKPAMTRKLRRRPHDPAPLPDKRRGKLASLPSHLNYLLEEKEIENDLKTISRGLKIGPPVRKPTHNAILPIMSSGPVVTENNLSETRIEDGKLLYERRWFHRGQPVYIEGKDMSRFPAIISAIGTEAIWVKKTSDASKVRIYVSQLSRGKVSIKRRAS